MQSEELFQKTKSARVFTNPPQVAPGTIPRDSSIRFRVEEVDLGGRGSIPRNQGIYFRMPNVRLKNLFQEHKKNPGIPGLGHDLLQFSIISYFFSCVFYLFMSVLKNLIKSNGD